ncbi:hypothetical protein BD408DRAFT_39747 [Parasitella parasitica]|nr:hypothetical protein BD408DRAFT_39747 [Parasitella parasitica]
MSTRRRSRKRSASLERSTARNSRAKSPTVDGYDSNDEDDESIEHLRITIAALKSIISPEDIQILLKQQAQLVKQQAIMMKEMVSLRNEICEMKNEIGTIIPAFNERASTPSTAASASNYSAEIETSDELYRSDLNKLISDWIIEGQKQDDFGSWDYNARVDSPHNKSLVAKILRHVVDCKRADVSKHADNAARAKHWMVFDDLLISRKIKSRFTYDKRGFSEGEDKTKARLRSTRQKNRRIHKQEKRAAFLRQNPVYKANICADFGSNSLLVL